MKMTAFRILAMLFLTLGLTTSCRTRQQNSDTDGLIADIGGLFETHSAVDRQMSAEHLKDISFVGCGHHQGAVQFLIDDEDLIPKRWREESGQVRAYSRPVASVSECRDSEYAKPGKSRCYQKYRYQFYPAGVTPSRFIVEGTSPIFRQIPLDKYPQKNDACRFERRTALIFAAGVSNFGLGATWKFTDEALLRNLSAWNRNHHLPAEVKSRFGNEKAGHGKLQDFPGYIQIVQNRNKKADGPEGIHSEPDIATMAKNLQLAFRAGVDHVEIVTHSNGMITAQLGYGLFVRDFKKNLSQWNGERSKKGAQVKMKVNFYHLQAAASQDWAGNTSLDRFGFNTDFVPIARKVGYFSWQWDWDFHSYFGSVIRYLNPTFRYYYNRPDVFTWDNTGLNPIGQRESLDWQHDFNNNSPFGSRVKHFVCPQVSKGSCGPGHSQLNALWEFSNPKMPKTSKPIRWLRTIWGERNRLNLTSTQPSDERDDSFVMPKRDEPYPEYACFDERCER
jgi:hypothetical protein